MIDTRSLPFLLLVVALGLSGLASAETVFETAAIAVGEAAGGDQALGGYILGALLVGLILLFLMIAVGRDASPMLILGIVAVFASLAWGLGWWPIWIPVFVFLALAAGFVFGRDSGAQAA